MNRLPLRRTILVLSLAIPALSAGCDRHLANGKPAAIANSTPEERFRHILDSFRRRIEDQPVGFVVTDGGGRSTMLGTNKVTSTLIRPENPGDQYKAVVTVATESHYSLRRSAKAAEEAERERKSNNQGTNALDDRKDRNSTAILDPDLTAAPHNDNPQSATNSRQSDEDVVTRLPNQDVRKYELVDDGDHWTLVTKLDPKTEQSIKFAFDEALARQ